jgi:hypothetical protein
MKSKLLTGYLLLTLSISFTISPVVYATDIDAQMRADRARAQADLRRAQIENLDSQTTLTCVQGASQIQMTSYGCQLAGQPNCPMVQKMLQEFQASGCYDRLKSKGMLPN